MSEPILIDKAGTLYCGDALEILRTLPDGAAHCCVTSPPYWGLRDYGITPSRWPVISFTPMAGLPPMEVPAWEGCLGLEPDPLMYIGHVVAVFREAHRVLRPDGMLWVNLGDSYATGGKGGGGSCMDERRDGSWKGRSSVTGWRSASRGLKPQDLMGVPWRAAFALQADGWYLRQDIIWAKPNPMPESVRDRCTKAHEYLFLLSKSPRYYYDAATIAEPIAARGSGLLRPRGWQKGPGAHDAIPAGRYPHARDLVAGSEGAFGPSQRQRRTHSKGVKLDPPSEHAGIGHQGWSRSTAGMVNTRNKRDVWIIGTHPCKEAHFATYPPALIEPCILAGCPPDGIVLDMFMGSGTTARVAESKGRRWIGIEINPKYCVLAMNLLRRWRLDPDKYQIEMDLTAKDG